MKNTKFTEEQILFALKLSSAGQPISDVCWQIGFSEAIFNVWKNRYTDLAFCRSVSCGNRGLRARRRTST